MVTTDKFSLLRKLLRALGLSEERVEELVAWIEEWLSGEGDEAAGEAPTPIQYPYRLRDDFLTAAELAFYRALQPAVHEWAVVFPKVRLGDIFYAHTSDNDDPAPALKAWQRIADSAPEDDVRKMAQSALKDHDIEVL